MAGYLSAFVDEVWHHLNAAQKMRQAFDMCFSRDQGDEADLYRFDSIEASTCLAERQCLQPERGAVGSVSGRPHAGAPVHAIGLPSSRLASCSSSTRSLRSECNQQVCEDASCQCKKVMSQNSLNDRRFD